MKEPSLPPGMPQPPAPIDLSGQTLGDFLVLRKLGQGGMGQVYLAEQVSLKRNVALKVLKPELAANETSLKRFKLEAEAVAKVTHANIVQVYAISSQDKLHYMALEYVDGFTLADYVAKKGPPELTLALSIMKQVASALARASEAGIIHRDIKPENILLTRKGEAKVADFGLSRCFGDEQHPSLTSSGVAMGTPLYMSPEQVQGQPVDPRTDIYSFGVTCYYMLTGQPPFRGQSAFEVAIQHVQSVPEPLIAVRPDLPPGLYTIVAKMMAKNPAERYQTGREIVHDVSWVRASISGQTGAVPNLTAPVATIVPASAPATMAPTAKPASAFPIRLWLLALVGLSVVLASIAGAALAWKLQRGRSATDTYVSTEEQMLKRLAARARSQKQNEEYVQDQVNLGLFYLDQGRLQEAEAAFRRGSTPESQEVGKLGKALVLSFQDRPRESYEAFLAFKKALEANPERAQRLMNELHLRKTIAQSLDRNLKNGEPVPAELEKLTRPGPVFGK
jgi:serine/threonine-protein kinase